MTPEGERPCTLVLRFTRRKKLFDLFDMVDGCLRAFFVTVRGVRNQQRKAFQTPERRGKERWLI
jgi:hypothetical protein